MPEALKYYHCVFGTNCSQSKLGADFMWSDQTSDLHQRHLDHFSTVSVGVSASYFVLFPLTFECL